MNTLIVCAFCLTSLLMFGPAFAQEEPQASEEHQVLQLDVGTWKAAGKLFTPGVDEPTEFEGVETNQMVGSMWLKSDFKGDFFGTEFVGHAVGGYDPSTKKYVSSWVDSMNPYAMHMQGTYDKAKKTMTMETSGKDPAGNPTKGKSVVEYRQDGSRMMTMYTQAEGADEMTKMMEIHYTKIKDDKE
jgi:hypothetical protein